MFTMQLLTEDGWQDVKGSMSHHPYEFDTQLEAEHMLHICYPEQLRNERIGGEQTVRVWPKEISK